MRTGKAHAAVWVATACLLSIAGQARSLEVPPKALPVPTGLMASSALPTKVAEPSVPPPAYASDALFGPEDEAVRKSLAHEDIAAIEKGRGGRSLAFRITLKDGTKGYFKPEQTFSAANWFGEVAAYHLDRMLGLGRVPAVVSRVFPWRALAPVAGSDPRTSEVTAREGTVKGAFVAWVTGGLRPLAQQDGWERWLRVEHWATTAVSPFQRPTLWARDVSLSRRMGHAFRAADVRAKLRAARPEPDRSDRPAELSDLIVFDYLTRNLDRWGGGNANVLVRGANGPLVFLDNGAGFEPGQWRPELGEARLHVLQRFRRRTIAAVRAFELKRYEARLAGEAVTPVLNRPQLLALETRRKALLNYVAELETAYGEAIWVLE